MAEQKRQRLGTPRTRDSGCSPRVDVVTPQALLESLQVEMPSASDFAAILRVCECAALIAEMVEDDPELLLLRKKLKKDKAINSDLEADLMDREDKLSCCNNELVPDLIEDNRFLRSLIASLSNAEAGIAVAEGMLAAREAEAERATVVERELAEARRQEEEAKKSRLAFWSLGCVCRRQRLRGQTPKASSGLGIFYWCSTPRWTCSS